MWEQIEVLVGPARHRGRYKVEGRQLVLEWRGGRTQTWCGMLKPEIVAASHLRTLVTRPAVAA